MPSLFTQLKEAGECVARTLVCFALIGPLLSVIGIAFLASSGNDTRTPKLEAYSSAVSAWTSGGFQQFQYQTYSMQVLNTGSSNAAFAIPVSKADPLVVDKSADVATYTKRIRAEGIQLIDNFPFGYVSNLTTQPVIEQLQVTDAVTGLKVSVSVPMGWKSVTFPCAATDDADECVNKCNSRGGSTGAGGVPNQATTPCNRYFLLSLVCIVANNASTGGGTYLFLDYSAAYGYGCASVISDAASSPFAKVSVGVLGPFGFTAYSQPPSTWPTVTFTVRSSSDPYVTAMRLTGGQPQSFGLTTAEKIRIGFVLLGVGLGLTALAACVIRAVLRGVCGKHSTAKYYTPPSGVHEYGKTAGYVVQQPAYAGQQAFPGVYPGPGQYAVQPSYGLPAPTPSLPSPSVPYGAGSQSQSPAYVYASPPSQPTSAPGGMYGPAPGGMYGPNTGYATAPPAYS